MMTNRSGYALIVVLFSLAILAGLLALSQARVVAHMLFIRAEQDLLISQQNRRDLLRLAARVAPSSSEPSLVLLPDGVTTLAFHDVAGFIDLNTGSSALRGILQEELNLDPDSDRRYSEWRRSGRRLQSLADYLRIMRLGPEYHQELGLLATVHSGRQEIALLHATAQTRLVLNGRSHVQETDSASTSTQRLVVFLNSFDDHRLGTIVSRGPEFVVLSVE